MSLEALILTLEMAIQAGNKLLSLVFLPGTLVASGVVFAAGMAIGDLFTGPI